MSEAADDIMNSGFSSALGRHIFLDRYALKDADWKSKDPVGRKVVVHFSEGGNSRSKVGTVIQEFNGLFGVRLENGERHDDLKKDVIDFLLETDASGMWKRLASAAVVGEKATNISALEADYFNTLRDFKFVPAGRILTGLGSGTKAGLFNCFKLPHFKDSREGIMERATQMMNLMAAGGGVGLNYSALRPRFSEVRGVNGRSSGAVSWADLHSFITGLVSQGGTRRGAAMSVLMCWHPDVIEFIHSKKDKTRLLNTNISVGVTDRFIEAVNLDESWALEFPQTNHPQYKQDWDGNLDHWKSKGYPVDVYGSLAARDLWMQICQSAWASAEPGVWFSDRANKLGNSHWYTEGELVGTNPCQPAWATVATPEGVRTIDDIGIGDTIWQGRWAKVTNKQHTGEKMVIAYKTRAGVFYGTENHRILQNGEKIEVSQAETIDICQPLPCKTEELDIQDVVDGLVFGDGMAKIFTEARNQKYNRVLLCVGKDDEEAYQNDEVCAWIGTQYGRNDSRNVITTLDLNEVPKLPFREVPDRFRFGSPRKMRGFLRGLFSANGSVVNSRITLKITCKKALEVIQEMLSFLGVASYYTTNPAKEVEFKNGTYLCKESYCLNIGTKQGRQIFSETMGFIHPYKTEKLNEVLHQPNSCKSAKTSFEIVEIEELGVEPVFSLTVEDDAHTYWTGGLLVANCGEQSLPANGVCDLGHLNLSKFFNPVTKGIDWVRLGDHTRVAVRFLDQMIEINHYVTPECEAQQKGERRIGLGTMGLADLLARMEVRYGSPESLKIVGELYQFIANEAYMASSLIAKEKGAFPWFDADQFLACHIPSKLDPKVRKHIAQYGIRNVTILTQAPTGTVGTMVQTSTGIEPYFELEWNRTSRMGTHKESVAPYREWCEKNPNATEIPSWFVTSMQLTPTEHLEVMAEIQKWTDSSISKTINMPHEATVEQVSELYMQLYQLGCKGGTIYRDGSRSEQVLNKIEEEKPKEESKEVKEVLKIVEHIATVHPVVQGPIVARRPDMRRGVTISKATPVGTAHITVNEHEGQPFEVFVDVGRGGSDVKAMAEAVGRLTSLLLRLRSDVKPLDRINEIVGQLKGIGGGRSVGMGPNRIKSLPDAVALVLEELYLKEPRAIIQGRLHNDDLGDIVGEPNYEIIKLPPSVIEEWNKPFEFVAQADICDKCGDASMVQQGGCSVCRSCGNSHC